MRMFGGTEVLCSLAVALLAAGCGGGSSDGAAAAVAPGGGAGSPAAGSGSPGGGGAPTSPAPTNPTPAPTPAPTPPPPASGPFEVARASLGTNLVAVSYYSPQWPFVDAMKSSRVNSSGFPWSLVSGGQPTPALDAQGYPIGLGSAQSVSTLMLRGIGSHFPAGEYVVLFEGQGTVEVSFDGGRASHTHDGNGTARFTLAVTPSGNGLTVKITRSSAADHVRNIRVIMPGFEATHASAPFHPLFLERLAPFTVLRFMDWGETNRSPVSSWSQRKRPDYRSQHGKKNGVAYEVMADLCNRTKKHPWICVPHKANDDYVRKLAELLRDEVDPDLKIFVEYSNEVWNGAFSQHNDVKSVAASKGLDWYTWYTRRSVQIFDIFEQVFGGRDRLVRVLGSQAGNPWIGKQIVAALPAGKADALAIAPYFGGRLGNGSNWQTTRTWSVSQVLDACQADLARQRDLSRQNKAFADAAGLALIAYEGGQHLAGVGSATNDTTLVNLFIQANRHTRMKQLYLDYLADWKALGGGAFVHFNDVYVPQKWGCWGALEYQDSDPTSSPKYSALVETARQWAAQTAAAATAGGGTQ